MRKLDKNTVRKLLPSPKSIAVWTGAILLALWSLPTEGGPWQLMGAIHHPGHGHPIGQAVPTTAAVPDSDVSGDRPLPAPVQTPGGVTPRKGHSTPTPSGNHTLPAPAPVPDPTPPSAPGPGDTAAPGTQTPGVTFPTNPAPFNPYVPWPTERMRVHVIDGRSQQPIQGAEVVLIETEQRLTTGPDGWTPWFDAPVVRDPRFRPLVQELHGQLGVIVYKNGYRDSIHFGIRVHPGVPAETTVWMYKLGPGDTRIEPVFYEEPYHHIWLVELADRFRSATQPGEGPERP